MQQTVTAGYRYLTRLTVASNPPEGARWKLDPSSPDGFYDAQSLLRQ